MKKVAMIGCGKLGQDCAEVMAEHYDVVGYDIEPRNPSNFRMRSSIEEAVKDRDMIFIAAPTPHDVKYGGEQPTSHLPNKDFDYTIVKEILSEVNKYVTKNQLVILISTVLPGTVRNQLEPCINNARFIYNPYLIAMGTIKWDMVNPEMVIIGTETGYTTGDAQELIDFYKVFMQNNPRYEVGTWDEAEAIKIFYNTFISTKLALVNMIQDVAETNGNMNVDVVTNALAKSTYRIMGPAYMKAGLGDAGACHPRDNIALRWLAERLDLGYDLFDSIMKARELQAKRMAEACLAYGKRVTIVGKAYKPKVHYTNGSASMLVGHYIKELGGEVNYYDIHTGDNNLRADWAEVFLIGYWDDYVEKIRFPDSSCVIDPWRKITKTQAIHYIHYGDTRDREPNNFFKPSSELITDSLNLPDPAPINYEAISDYTVKESDNLNIILEAVPEFAEYKNSTMGIDTSDLAFISLPITTINNAIIFNLNNGKSKFLFNTIESGLDPIVLDKVYDIVINLREQIPLENFIIISGAINANEVYEKYLTSTDKNFSIPLRVVNLNEHLIKKHNQQFRFLGEYRPLSDNQSKHKKFLSLNKTPKKITLDLVEHLLYSGAVSEGFFSFIPDKNWIDEIDKLDSKKYPTIKSMAHNFPMYLTKNMHRDDYKNLHEEDLHYYDQSWFSILTEEDFYSDNRKIGIVPSEKVYKCFVMKHPFIVFGPPRFLKHLRAQGYMTFGPYIDETYDTIEDDDLRFRAVLDEITRLCSLDSYESIDWTTEIKPLVEHNRYNFFSKEIANVEIKPQIAPVSAPQKKSNNSLIDQIKDQISIVNSNTGDITLMPILETDNRAVFSRLDSGILLSYPAILDGGGVSMHKSLANLIRVAGSKKTYDKGLEWCAGCGALGFELLGSRLCKEMVFSDYMPLAIEYCKKNAETNGFSKLVSGYVTPKIQGIPLNEKFDLVISNPPHVPNLSTLEQMVETDPNIDLASLANIGRWIVDINWNIHKEFFNNISSYLTDDADIFLIETNESSILANMAEEYGLHYITSFDFYSKDNNVPYVCLHFRKIKSAAKGQNYTPSFNKTINSSDTKVRLESIKYDDGEVHVVPISDLDGTDDIMFTSTLSNGLTLEYPRCLDGDGKNLKEELIKLIRKIGKNNYQKGLQWCSGVGYTGFELLMHKVVNEMSFSDYYPTAIDFVLSNARNLSIQDKVHGHVTPLISELPEVEKYDMVIGLPPNSFDLDGYCQFMKNNNVNIPINELSNFSRICVDQNFDTHREFFKNITKHLNPNSDIFLIENAEHLEFIIWARNAGLIYAGPHYLQSMDHRLVMHFKYKP